MAEQRQVQAASALLFDEHGAEDDAANDVGLRFGSAVREPWDYVPVPPFALDDDGYLTDDSLPRTDRHTARMLAYGPVLEARHRNRGFVGVDLSMPYVKGSPGKMLAPDLFVALTAERNEDRSSYKLWEEPVPDFVLEDLSPANWRRDAVDKRVLYRRLGVAEYWMFDETGTRLRDGSGSPLGESLVGFSLCDGEYKRIHANESLRLPSEVLKLELCVRDGLVRFHDPATGDYLPTYDEALAGMQAAQARIAALEAELRVQRAGSEGPKADS